MKKRRNFTIKTPQIRKLGEIGEEGLREWVGVKWREEKKSEKKLIN
jgi:hypothetical protein